MWFYKGQVIKEISEFPENTYGFIYKITRIDDGKFYVGRKNLYSERTKALTKKELAEHTGKGKKPTKKKVTAESDWKDYYGSEASLKLEVKQLGKGAFKREIIYLCTHKKQMTYQELRHQILQGCLESDNCYNGNILGKFWKKDI
jgi:Putative endonuclease segE, GIY-YIG domain